MDKGNSNRKLQVFLCHSSGDKETVRILYQRLSGDGFDPWLDENKLLPGQEWELEIRKAVQKSDIIIICLSENSINRKGFVQKEIKYALDIADEQPEGAIFLIPLRLEACETPERLRHKHRVDFFKADGYERLVSALRIRINELGLNVLRALPKDVTREASIEQTTEITEGQHHIDLAFFEGAWVDKLSKSTFYARVIYGELLMPYCYGGNSKLTGRVYNFRIIGNTLFARFKWFNSQISGFFYLKVESENKLVGGWWYTEDLPMDLLGDISSIDESAPSLHESILERKLVVEEYPMWAERYFMSH